VPLLAPVAGAELLALGGWRGIFAVLAAASAVLLVVSALVVPETHRPSSSAHPLRHRLGAVLGDARFRWAALVGSMTYAGVYAYVAASPMLLQDVYGLSPRAYSLVFLANSLGLVAGVQLSSALARRYGAARSLLGWAAVTVLAAALAAPLQWAGTGLAGLLPCLWLFVTGCGGCFPCAAALALDGQGDQPGTATSLYGFATFATAGLVSPVAGLIGIGSVLPVALVLLAGAVVALLGTVPLLRHRDGRASRHGPATAG
jgi:MFS transporter, DHA1 family, multidrug resistance protein